MSIYSEEKCASPKAIGDDINEATCKFWKKTAQAEMDYATGGILGEYCPKAQPLKLLQNHKFCSLAKFLDFINVYEYRQLHVECSYESVQQNFMKLQINAPFGFFFRFPDNFYVHMDSTKIKTATEEFMDSLNYLDSVKALEMKMYALTKATDVCNAALRRLSTICKSMDIKCLKENGIYCRETFEEKYGLIWYPGEKVVTKYITQLS